MINGTMPFAAALIRVITLPLQYDSFAFSNYANTQSAGKLKIRSEQDMPIENRHILLVDDVPDTGYTMHCMIQDFQGMRDLIVKSCILPNKNIAHNLFPAPDGVGLEIPDKFVVGYNLGHNEEYRDLPYIGILPNNQP